MTKKTKSKVKIQDPKPLLDAVIHGIREKKGKEIRLIDLTEMGNASADYFIICHGDSQRQAAAIADSVEDEVRKMVGEKPWHTEGAQNAHWILMDYVNVVVHIFYKEAREFYDIENLWADAKISIIDENEAVPAKKAIPKKKVTSPAIKKKAGSSSNKTTTSKSVVSKGTSKKAAVKRKKK